MATKRDLLDQVLEDYAASEPGPSRASLTDWIRQYPEFERELTEFTARWSMLKWLPDVVDDHEVDEETLVLQGMSSVQSVLFRDRQRSEERANEERAVEGDVVEQPGSRAEVERPIAGLLAEGKRVGLSPDDLAVRVGISDGLLRKMDRRLIDPRSIPTPVSATLAQALQRTLGEVTAYAHRPPTFAVNAQYRAAYAPRLAGVQEDFFDAVRNDLTLSDEQRQQLLALTRPPEGEPTEGDA